MGNETPFEQRRDALARILAASLIQLEDDATGADLPEDCWGQMRAKANAILFIVSQERSAEHLEAGVALERSLEEGSR